MNDFHQILGENPIILFLPGLVAYMMHEISYFDIKVTDPRWNKIMKWNIPNFLVVENRIYLQLEINSALS